MTAVLHWLPWIITALSVVFAFVAEGDACHAEAMAEEHEADCDYYRSLLGWLGKGPRKTQADIGQGDEDFPADFFIGTASNPIVLPHDTARYSSLDSFCPKVLP